MSKVMREWYGPEVQMRVHRASGRGIVSIGMHISNATKIITHKLSGTLARSVHVAPGFYESAGSDERYSLTADLGPQFSHIEPIPTKDGPAVEVGSWLSYACVEWVGRGHPGITQGMEAVRGQVAWAIMKRAFREEGL